MAVSMGYPYLRGEGRVAADGRTWLSRVTKTSDGSGPALFIGWDSVTHKWVVEKNDDARNPSKSYADTGGLHVEYSPVNQAYFLMWHGSILRIFPTKKEAKDEMAYLLRKGAEQNPDDLKAGTDLPSLGRNPFDWREQRQQTASSSPLYDSIRHGDKVTIVDRFGQSRTGRAVMRGPAGWVLNMGGRHGTPGIAAPQNVTRVRRGNPDSLERVGKMLRYQTDSKEVADIWAKHWKDRRFKVKRRKLGKDFVVEAHPTRRSNPDDEQLDEAESLYEAFHGRAPREILEMQESSEQRGEYTALGDLIELTMIAPTGDHVMVKFKDDGVRLASSPNGEQLYLLGGNQDITESLEMFGADAAKDLIDLGEAKQIVYEAAKWQTDFDPQEWKHDFGEESGVRPRGFFDQLKKRIFFAGGNYKVKRPGIVD